MTWKRWSVMVVFLLSVGHAEAAADPPLVKGPPVKVAVLQFTIEGTPGFLITPEILTATLMERVGSPFEVIHFGQGEHPHFPHPLLLRGVCALHKDHTLDIRLFLLSQFGDSLSHVLQRVSIDQAQQDIVSFLLRSVDTLTVTTVPPGALVSLDGATVGAAPFRYFPVVMGTHVIQANFGGPKGLVVDTLRFPKTRRVTLTSPLLTQKPTTAKILFQGVEPADIWLNGKKLGSSDQGWIEVPPGEHTFEIVSPAFGTRQITLRVEAGRRYRVKY